MDIIQPFACQESPGRLTACDGRAATAPQLLSTHESHLAVITDGHELFRAVGDDPRQLVWDREKVQHCLDIVGCGRIIVAANLSMQLLDFAQQLSGSVWRYGNKVRTVSLLGVWDLLEQKYDPSRCVEVFVLSKEHILQYDNLFHLGWSPHVTERATSSAVVAYTDIKLEPKALLDPLHAGDFFTEQFTRVHVGPPSDLVQVR